MINENRFATVRIALFVFAFVFFFLYVFRPFGIESQLPENIELWDICLRFSFSSSLAYLLFVELMMKFFPKWLNEQSWTLGKDLIFINMILIAISIVNAFVGDYCGFESQYNAPTVVGLVMEGVKHTYLVGLFPVALIIVLNNIILIKRNYEKAEINNEAIENIRQQVSTPSESKPIAINSQATSNTMEVDLEDLLFIMADGNYVEYHLRSNGSVKREIQRNTLTNIERQLSDYDFLFRSHRAYLVNLKKIKESNGNAQGYQLKFDSYDHVVPVSRQKLGDFDELIAKLA